MAASASWISLYRWGVGASCRLRQVTRFAGGPFFPRRAAVVVLEPAFVMAGREAVDLGAVAPFETPHHEGAAFFFVTDAADFFRVFLGAVVFFVGVVSSALQPSAASAAMPAQHRMVRMLVVQFNAARWLARRGPVSHLSGRSGACRPQTPGPTPRWDRALFAAPGT